MSDYSNTDWSVKDDDTILASEINVELISIETAVNSKSDKASFTVSTSDPSGGVDGDVWYKV
jgi:hypothetical protein